MHLIAHRIVLSPLLTHALIEQPVTQAQTHKQVLKKTHRVACVRERQQITLMRERALT